MKKKDLEIIIESIDQEDLSNIIKIYDGNGLLFYSNYIERIIRSSDFYRVWREYNKRKQNATKDVIQNIDTLEFSKISIELHHYPYTLFDIVMTVGEYLLDTFGETDPFEISKVVLEEHLSGNIGYVPLLITDHQKHHSQLLDIELDKVKGNYKEFERKYKTHTE